MAKKRKGGTVVRRGARQSKHVAPTRGASERLKKAGKRNIAPMKKGGIDSRVTSFGDTWDTYRLELKNEADITPEAIKKVFRPLQENLRDLHSRQSTLLRVRVALLTSDGKARETWVHVSSRVPFGVAFDSIEENVERWLLHSNYATFDAVEVSSRRP